MRKKISLVLLVLTLAATYNLFGCAQLGPYAVSEAVYTSSRDAIAEKNNAQKETAISDSLGEQLARNRAIARNIIALKEIESYPQEKGVDGGSNNGDISGGFPVIFINDSSRDKTLIITKADGDFRGQRWMFCLHKSGYRECKFETGDYYAQWTVEDSDILYPPNPQKFTVTTNPHFWHDQTSKNYHGGIRLFGY